MRVHCRLLHLKLINFVFTGGDCGIGFLDLFARMLASAIGEQTAMHKEALPFAKHNMQRRRVMC